MGRLSVAGREFCLDGRQSLLQPDEFVLRKVPGASGRDPAGALKQACTKIGMRRAAGDVAIGAHQPQTDREVGDGIVSDLLERRIQKAIEGHPRHHQPQHMRRRVVMRRRRRARGPAYDDTAGWSTQLIAVLGSLTAGEIARSPISTI